MALTPNFGQLAKISAVNGSNYPRSLRDYLDSLRAHIYSRAMTTRRLLLLGVLCSVLTLAQPRTVGGAPVLVNPKTASMATPAGFALARFFDGLKPNPRFSVRSILEHGRGGLAVPC